MITSAFPSVPAFILPVLVASLHHRTGTKLHLMLAIHARPGLVALIPAQAQTPHFRNHPKNRKKVQKADRKLQTMACRPVREFKRNPGENHNHDHSGCLRHFFLKVGTTVKRSVPFMSPMSRRNPKVVIRDRRNKT